MKGGGNSWFATTWVKARTCVAADPSWAFFLLFAFSSMVSLPVARASMLLSLAFSLASPSVRRRFRLTPPGLGWLAYFVLAVAVSGAMAVANTDWGVAHGLMPAVDPYIEPARGFRKLPKLLWFLAIPLAAVQVRDSGRFKAVLKAWIAGGAVLALVILVFHPPIAWLQVHVHGGPAWVDRWLSDPTWARWGGRPPSFQLAFSSLGTMRDAQRLMIALIATSCALVSGERGTGKWLWGLAALLAFSLVLTCKRGPLLVGVAVVFSILAVRVKWWRILVLALVVAIVAFAVPQSRFRLLMLRNEVSFNDQEIVRRGGRLMMWTHIVPKLHGEYPRGLGFRSLTAIKMHNADWHVEKNRTHVHSVPLQAFVDFGWAGPAIWLFWMVLSFRCAVRVKRHGRSIGLARGESLLPLASLAALVAFGFVEYNIADAAVVPLYALSMGLACLGVCADGPQGLTPAFPSHEQTEGPK